MSICWPSELVGYVLQQNSVLEATGWEDVTLVPFDSGLNVSVTVDFEPGDRFFRLRPPVH
jgi:hypothetical protein